MRWAKQRSQGGSGFVNSAIKDCKFILKNSLYVYSDVCYTLDKLFLVLFVTLFVFVGLII